MKKELEIKRICEQVGLHIPDLHYIYKRLNSAKTDSERKAWVDLFNFYKGAMKND